MEIVWFWRGEKKHLETFVAPNLRFLFAVVVQMSFKQSPSVVFGAGKTYRLPDDKCCPRTTLVMQAKGSNCARVGAFAYSGMVDLLEDKDDTDLTVQIIATETNSHFVRLPRAAAVCGMPSVLRSDWETPHFVPLQRVHVRPSDQADTLRIQNLLTRPRLLVLLHEEEIYPDGHFFALCKHTGRNSGTWSCIDPLRQSGKPFVLTDDQVLRILNTASYALYPK